MLLVSVQLTKNNQNCVYEKLFALGMVVKITSLNSRQVWASKHNISFVAGDDSVRLMGLTLKTFYRN